MPRIARETIKVPYIHVMTQGIKKEYIFEKKEYKEEYLKLIKKAIKEQQDFYMLSYCIMDNHAHFLIHTKRIENLSKVMSKANSSYANFYNKKEERVGYVFKNRYNSQPIMNERHLYNTVVYIHKNPVKAGIVKKMEKYPYSSYVAIKNKQIEKDCMELLFHTKDYIKRFDWIHQNYEEENILEVKEESTSKEKILEYIYEFCRSKQVEIKEITTNNYLLNKMINQLKENYKVSNKEICQILKIGKNRISNLKKQCN